MLVGRSFKYHRPRGVVSSGAEEPNALVNLGKRGKFEPNQRATTTELFEGLQATSQNHWPSLEFDVGAINSKLSRFCLRDFITRCSFIPVRYGNMSMNPLFGSPPDWARHQAPKTPAHMNISMRSMTLQLSAAASLDCKRRVAGASGKRVLLMEQTAHWGGRAQIDEKWSTACLLRRLWTIRSPICMSLPNVTLRTRMMGAGIYDHGYLLGYERLSDHVPDAAGPRHRLWRIRVGHIITATGAIERPLSFAENDKPGVILASALRDYLIGYGVSLGDRTVVVTNNDDAYLTAIAVKNAGLDVPAIIDARQGGAGELGEKPAIWAFVLKQAKA